MPLGYIVENRVLRRVLLDRARALPSLRLIGGRRVAAMHATETGADIALDDGTRLRARLVAAADGKEFAAAPCRRHPRDRMALPSDRHCYDRRARAPACRHRRRAFSARRPVRDPADDRRAGPARQIPARALVDRVDRTRRSRAAPAGAARSRLRRRIARPLRRVSRRDRAGRAALEPIRWR